VIIVAGGRRTGKTEAILRWIAESPEMRCVIVKDNDRAAYIIDRLRSYIKDYPWRQHVITAGQIAIGGYTRGRNPAFHFPEVAIDDAEEVFSVMFGVTLEFMSMNATYIPLGPQQPDVVRARATIQTEIHDRPVLTLIEGGEYDSDKW